MFKIFEKDEKVSPFPELLEKEDHAGIIKQIEKGHEMTAEEEKTFESMVEEKIKNEGIIFLSELYKEGFEISDEWLIKWSKSRNFVNNYNLQVFGADYFKERLENIAPDILN